MVMRRGSGSGGCLVWIAIIAAAIVFGWAFAAHQLGSGKAASRSR